MFMSPQKKHPQTKTMVDYTILFEDHEIFQGPKKVMR